MRNDILNYKKELETSCGDDDETRSYLMDMGIKALRSVRLHSSCCDNSISLSDNFNVCPVQYYQFLNVWEIFIDLYTILRELNCISRMLISFPFYCQKINFLLAFSSNLNMCKYCQFNCMGQVAGIYVMFDVYLRTIYSPKF